MGFSIHSITMPDGGGPVIQDRLHVASVLNIPFPAAAAAGATIGGSVTAGSGYTFTPTATPTGGVVTAASAAGVAPVVAVGWPAVLRCTMKVVSAGVTVGGSGWATNDTVLLANGVELTVTASAGAIASLAVTTAGAVTQPGPLPSTGVQVISTSGSGIGAVLTLSWGLLAVVIDDSGNYGTLPTGITIASVDGNGTLAAIAGGVTVGTTGTFVFRQIAVGGPQSPLYGVVASVTPATIAALPLVASVATKLHGLVTVRIAPAAAANAVTAGTVDVFAWA